MVNYCGPSNTLSPRNNKLIRQPSATTCSMLTPSTRSMDDHESPFVQQTSLLEALSIDPLDPDEQNYVSDLHTQTLSTNEKSAAENVAEPSCPLRKVARKLSWSNMDIPVYPSTLRETVPSSPRKQRPTSPSRRPRQPINPGSPRRKALRQKSSSFNNLRPRQVTLEPYSPKVARPRSPLKQLAKQFSLTTLRNLSPLKGRDTKAMKKQTSLINLTSLNSPKKTKQKHVTASSKKEPLIVNCVKSTRTKKSAPSLSKHLSNTNLFSPEASEESSFAESSTLCRSHARNTRRGLYRQGSSSRSFRPTSLRNIKVPSLRSLCSGAETSAVDTSTPEAAVHAEEQVRSCSPVRTHRDLVQYRSTHSSEPAKASQHSRQPSPQRQRRTPCQLTESALRTQEPLKRSSNHGKTIAPSSRMSSSHSPMRKPRDERSETKAFQCRHEPPKRGVCNKHSDVASRSNSPLRNSCHGTIRTPLSPKTKLSSLSQSMHGSPRKIRDMKHPPQTKANRKLNTLHGQASPIVAPMTPTSLRKKYGSMASLADEYDKIVSISLD